MRSLVLVVAGLIFKLGSQILLVMFVLWLIGFLYPFVAVAVGIPYATFYDFVAHLFSPFAAAYHAMYDTARCVR